MTAPRFANLYVHPFNPDEGAIGTLFASRLIRDSLGRVPSARVICRLNIFPKPKSLPAIQTSDHAFGCVGEQNKMTEA